MAFDNMTQQITQFPQFPWKINVENDKINVTGRYVNGGYSLEAFIQECSMRMFESTDFYNTDITLEDAARDSVLKAIALARKLGYDSDKLNDIEQFVTGKYLNPRVSKYSSYLTERLKKLKE